MIRCLAGWPVSRAAGVAGLAPVGAAGVAGLARRRGGGSSTCSRYGAGVVLGVTLGTLARERNLYAPQLVKLGRRRGADELVVTCHEYAGAGVLR